jgi:hypothetical protein
MLLSAALVRTDVSEEISASFSHLVFLRRVRRLLVTANVVPNSPILVPLMKEELSFSETLVLTRATRHNIPGDAILYSHRRKTFKSYTVMKVVFRNTSQQSCHFVLDVRNATKFLYLQGVFEILERAKNFKKMNQKNKANSPFLNGFLLQELEKSEHVTHMNKV